MAVDGGEQRRGQGEQGAMARLSCETFLCTGKQMRGAQWGDAAVALCPCEDRSKSVPSLSRPCLCNDGKRRSWRAKS